MYTLISIPIPMGYTFPIIEICVSILDSLLNEFGLRSRAELKYAPPPPTHMWANFYTANKNTGSVEMKFGGFFLVDI